MLNFMVKKKKKNNSFKRTDCSDWRDNVIIIDW